MGGGDSWRERSKAAHKQRRAFQVLVTHSFLNFIKIGLSYCLPSTPTWNDFVPIVS